MCRMSSNPTPEDQALASSPSAETESSKLPMEDTATVPEEPPSCSGKKRGKKAKTRNRKGKDGVMDSDSSVEGHELPTETAIVSYEPQNSLAVDQMSEPPVDGMSIVPHETEGTNEPTKCRKGKKRGRHFDREVRAKILHVCLSHFSPPFVLLYAVA